MLGTTGDAQNVMVASCGSVTKRSRRVATRPLTRDYALVPLRSLNCTIATIFRTGWLSLVPQGTALKIFRDYKLFGQLSPGTLLGRSKGKRDRHALTFVSCYPDLGS